MALGLRRDVVKLVEHDPKWKTEATKTIERLWQVFGSVANDIQHVGSTAIENIKAKPIIDIVVAVDNFTCVESLTPELEANGFMQRSWYDDTQMLFAVGEDVEPNDRITTHFIHIVKTDSVNWYEYIHFRDYLNSVPTIASEYENIKTRLAVENPHDKRREKYLAGKSGFIKQTLSDALSVFDIENREMRTAVKFHELH